MIKNYSLAIFSVFIISFFLVSCAPKINDLNSPIEPQINKQIDAHCKYIGLDDNRELCITNLAKEREDASFCTNLLEGNAMQRCLSEVGNSQ